MTSEERRVARRVRREAKRNEKKEKLAEEYDDINQVANAKHLLYSAKQSRKGVRFKASVQKYFINILHNIFRAKRDILNGKDVRMGFIEFVLSERGKTRNIRAMKFSERVIQCCLCTFVLVPYLLISCVFDNGASQKYKGIHFALKRCEEHINGYYKRYGQDGYVLSIDFSGYFDNIEHEHIFEIIEEKFKDQKLKLLIIRFIEAFGKKSLGIGSQVSQIFAVLYVSEIDHYIREVLHIGLSARYMDDSYLMHPDKEYLQNTVLPILVEKYAELGITVNMKKTKIVSTKDFKFLKVRFLRLDSGKILKLPDSKAFVRERRKMKKFAEKLKSGEMTIEDIRTSYQSFYGYYQHLDCKKRLHEMDVLYYRLYGEKPEHKKKKKPKTFKIEKMSARKKKAIKWGNDLREKEKQIIDNQKERESA